MGALVNDLMNVQNRKPATYKAKTVKCDETWDRDVLDGFGRQNSGSYGPVQLNEDKSSCRSFISNAKAVAIEAVHLLADGLDCATTKVNDDEGRYLPELGRRTDGTKIIIAFGLVLAEAMNNYQ